MQYATCSDPNSAFRAYPPKNSDSSMATIFPGSSRCFFFPEEHLQVVHHHSPPAALLGHILKRFSRWVSPASAASNSSSEIWQSWEDGILPAVDRSGNFTRLIVSVYVSVTRNCPQNGGFHRPSLGWPEVGSIGVQLVNREAWWKH